MEEEEEERDVERKTVRSKKDRKKAITRHEEKELTRRVKDVMKRGKGKKERENESTLKSLTEIRTGELKEIITRGRHRANTTTSQERHITKPD